MNLIFQGYPRHIPFVLLEKSTKDIKNLGILRSFLLLDVIFSLLTEQSCPLYGCKILEWLKTELNLDYIFFIHLIPESQIE